MPVPALDPWRARSDAMPLHRLLGIRADAIGPGFAQYRVVPAPGSAPGIDGVEGGSDGRVSTFAITTAADLCVMSASSARLEEQRQEMNGTAEMNLTYVAHPRGEAVVRGEVIHHAERLAIVAILVTDEHGATIAHGRGTYSYRPTRGRGA